MDIYKNNIFVHFLVCVPAISAQAWRYHRFVTGTIRSDLSSILRASLQGYKVQERRGLVVRRFQSFLDSTLGGQNRAYSSRDDIA